MSTPTRKPRKSRLGLLVALVGLAAGAWYVAQWVGGAQPARVDPPPEGARIAFRPLPYVNYGLTPDYTRDPGPRDTRRTSNALGFRGPDVEQPKPDGRLRIVCLGGSTTYSDLVDDDETYPAQLERILRERLPERDLEVVNAGVPSYTSAESLANLAFRCLELQPDVVVLYQAVNDLRTRKYANYDSAYFHYRRVWDGSLDAPGEAGAGDTAELRGGINPFIQYAPPPTDLSGAELVERSGLGAYRRNLVSLIGVSRAHGVEPVFVTFLADSGSQFVGEAMLRDLAGYNRVMTELGAEFDVHVIDLAGQLRPEGMFGDPVHMTAKGTLQKARVVAQGLIDGVL